MASLTVPARIAADCSAFELELLALFLADLDKPLVLTPREQALCNEATRLHALGKTL